GNGREAMLERPVVRPINELLSTLSRAPVAPAAIEEKLVWLGELVARLVAAASAFAEEPGGILAAQRALLVMPGLPGAMTRDLGALRERIRPRGTDNGLTRLLDSAPRRSVIKVTHAPSPEEMPPALRPMARELTQLARELQALDDLAYALDDRSDLSAGALVLDAVFDLGAACGTFENAEVTGLGALFVSHRSLDPRLATLLALRRAVETLDGAVLVEAERGGVLRALSLWVLAGRTARGQTLEASKDRVLLDQLLQGAGLAPVEVFDAASLWLDLEARHEP
ncbi:MAG: hypothetical protein ACO3JL_17350, partial [Myxococcota bacterium]